MSPLRTELKLAGMAIAALLSACGGGGGGGGGTTAPPPPAPIPTAACPMQVIADASVPAGKTAGVSVLPCSGASFAEVTWSQVSGPAVAIVTSRNPTIALDTSATGVVSIKADARYVDGRTATVTANVTVAEPQSGSYVTVRGDHAVVAGTNTSVRAWPVLAGGETLTGVTWTQVAGPSVTLDTSRPQLLMFTAPNVGSDTVLKFRATMTTSSGKQDFDEVAVGVERAAPAPNNAIFERVARVYPYRAGSTYSMSLQTCAYGASLYYTSDTQNNLCPIATLPLLQDEAGPGAVPTVAQIMGRVLVSHDYLGANFEQFLLTQDPHGDFRRMLASTTAIVIGSHVRPSMYTAATGAIYLDATNLWLTPEQRDIVSEVPDYRLAFDDQLNFSTFGRIVRNNAPARSTFPATERNNRPADQLVFSIGRLLYHELAHANDFIPPGARGGLATALPVWRNVAPRVTALTLPSDLLAQQYPLTSPEMYGLAQVRYLGVPPNETQKAYTAADVGRFFAGDRASDDYAYTRVGNTNSREDLAMLFEEFMMGYRHGVQYDMAYTNVFTEGMPPEQVIVAWGQRGRIGEASIRPRVKLVVQQIAPWIGPEAVDALPAPIQMRAGASWTENLVLGSATNAQRAARIIETPAQRAARMTDDLKKPQH